VGVQAHGQIHRPDILGQCSDRDIVDTGLGNLPGVIAAGLGIGALEQYGSHIFGIGYQQAIAVMLLLLVLLVRLIQQRRNRQVLK